MSTKETDKKQSNTEGADSQLATLAGGCFWGMEDLFRKFPGVLTTVVGYTGGNHGNPTYDIVKLGATNHAEALQITFDPKKVTYAEVLNYFFRIHDPTQLNRQEGDIGTQYRSVIFYHSEDQRFAALNVMAEIQTKLGSKKVVTQISPFSKFFPAEEDHQDYLVKNPKGYTCHYFREL